MLSSLDGWRSPAPDPARVAWMHGVTYAHRGLHGPGAIENSPTAFTAAIGAGLGIECDIQRSLDDWPMVFHDWDLKRMLGHDVYGESWLKDEWQKLRYLDSDDSPLTLSDLLELVAGKVPLLIEIKSKPRYDVEWTCLEVVLALANYRGRHAVMSFDPRVPQWLRKHSPQTVRGLVVSENKGGTPSVWRRHLALWRARPDFLAYDVRDLPSRFAAAQRARGLPVLTWTVSTSALAAVGTAHADGWIAEGAGLASLASSA